MLVMCRCNHKDRLGMAHLDRMALYILDFALVVNFLDEVQGSVH